MQEDGRDQDGTNPANRNISNTGAKESADAKKKSELTVNAVLGIGYAGHVMLNMSWGRMRRA